MLENVKRKRKTAFKKANLATWYEEDIDTREDEEIKEEALLYFMANGNNSSEVYDSSSSYSNDDNDMDDLYN